MFTRGFIVLWIAMLVAMAGVGMVGPLLPIYVREDLGGPEIAVALSFSGLAISMIIVAPFVGRLGDRFGVKRFIVSGFLIYAIGGIGYSFTNSWELVITFRVLSGFGAGTIFPLSLAYIGRIAPQGREGSYTGVFAVSQIAGFGAGPLIGGAIRDAINVDAAFFSMAVMLTVTGLLTFFLLPSENRLELSETVTDDQQKHRSAIPWNRIVRRIDIQAVVVASVVFSLGWGIAGTYLAIFVVTEDGLGTDSAMFVGLLLGARSLLGIVFQPIAGFTADRTNRVSLVVSGLFIAAIAQFVIPDLPRSFLETSFFGEAITIAPWLLGIIVIAGIGEAFAHPAEQAIFVSIGRKVGMASVMGMYQMGSGVGFLAGSLVGAILVSTSGIDSVFRATGIITVIGAILFAIMMRRANARESSTQLV